MPDKLKMLLPIITIILGATTLVSTTVAILERGRNLEIREEIKQLRTDLVANTRADNALEKRVIILETSIKGDLAHLMEGQLRVEKAIGQK